MSDDEKKAMAFAKELAAKNKENKKSSDYGWNHPINPTWEYHSYDGIKGFPPDWVPEPIMKLFCEKRGALFFEVEQEKVTYQEIKSRFDGMVENIDHAFTSFDVLVGDRRDYDHAVLSLADIFIVISKGEEKGLKLFAGNLAVSGFLSQQAYKQRDDYQDKIDCQAIAKELWKSVPDLTIAGLERSPALSAYKRKYKGRDTLRNWLKEIDPRTPETKRSRSKKK